jgi:hypothetical protein
VANSGVNDLNSSSTFGSFPGHYREEPMHSDKPVFAQVMESAPWHAFRRLVTKYRGDFNVSRFSCLDQFF